jgi:putative phosphoribosyl transferase
MAAKVIEQTVLIPAQSAELHGDLNLPPRAAGLVIFAHGSGSSRHSPRNIYVARELQKRAFGTLLLDLLTPEEEKVDSRREELRFNITLLADRLIHATAWVRQYPSTSTLPIEYFGASTGSAAALIAAAERPDDVAAIVSRGGRPDLAGSYLSKVAAPTLLIVGGDDVFVLHQNQAARAQMRAQTKLEIVPKATHLFEEPGALESVAQLAAAWFDQYLTRAHQNDAPPQGRAAN